MSFFGFDATLPKDENEKATRGMFDVHDPFAGLNRDNAANEGETLNFDDTYDGLGQSLEEAGDAFNDDTFGGGPATRQSLGRDFDFAGQTAAVRGTLQEEQALHFARQPPPSQQKPRKTGYENYRKPDYIPQLEADASIWGKKPEKRPEQPARQESGRKMMSLEEVEAMMRAQSQSQSQSRPQSGVQDPSQALRDMVGVGSPAPQQPQQPQRPLSGVPQILQRPQSMQQQQPQQPPSQPQSQPDYALRAPQILQRQHSPQPPRPQSQEVRGPPPQQPMPMQQHPQIPSQGPPPQVARGPLAPVSHNRGPSYNGPPITQAQQVLALTPEERQSYLEEEAKRAKRNHKIFLLSKDNGLMTPQDKNFITRIQLQQLLTATGGVDEQGPEAQLSEDFYYQVYAQIRGPPRSGPGQPLNQFAQTYLFQTGGRYGRGYGRGRAGGDNHVQRMEQQVARAVEAAKARPKNKSLVVEGSLGKIAFSNSKTPRPLLNFKRPDSERKLHGHGKPVTVANRKAALRDIEAVYSTLMQMEDHERRMPPPLTEESDPDLIQAQMEWRTRIQDLNAQLWAQLKVMEPIQQSPSTPHPFIAILSHPKGKKAIPRVFRHLDDQQRLTMLTLVVIHLDILDVIRNAYPPADGTPLPNNVKEDVELFGQAVMPSLFSYVNEAPLTIIIGLLGLVLDRVNVQAIIRTKIGVSMLTMLISRAELVKQQSNSAVPDSEDWTQWAALYSRLFDLVEPVLPYLFGNESVNNGDDVHVWQWLAAMGVGASPDQQQRLVLGVKDRVMETVGVSKTLPEDMASRRLGDVNLFMRAIGLDVELLG